MISNTLKINAIILFAVVLTASGGALIKQKTKIVDSYTNLKSNPLLSDISTYPGLKFHPHSKHYIYNFDTVEDTDKREFKDLASKLSQLPSNFPSTITLATVPTSSEVLNQGELLTNRELYLISKYWLQLLPQFHPELLKCLAGPTEMPTQQGDQFPSNCPSEILYLKQNTTASSSIITIRNPSFNIPYTLYAKLQKCPNSKCQGIKSENCYCAKKLCSDCSDINCKCYSESELTIGPGFFHDTSSIPSPFSYPQSTDKIQTFNATGTLAFTNPQKLPHFSFPLPHSSYTPSKTQNSIATSETASLSISPHWPQKITIKTNFKVELNGTESDNGETSLNVLVQKLLDSPDSYLTYGPKLQAHSPTQLFFVRYLATLYALLWSYSPDSLPLFSLDSQHSLLSEHDLPSSSNTSFYYTHQLPSNPINSKK